MECRIEDNILWVSGKLDSSTSSDFEAAVARLAESLVQQPPQAVLELSGIETLTSAPLRAMLTLAKRLHAAKGRVLLAAPSPIAVEALKVSGFMRLQVFHIVTSVSDITLAPSQVPQPAAVPERAPAPTTPQSPKVEVPQKPARSTTSSASGEPKAAPRERGTSPGLFRRLLKALVFWKR